MDQQLNIALAEDHEGHVLIHRADCPEIRRQTAEGRDVVVLQVIEDRIPDICARHTCLTH